MYLLRQKLIAVRQNKLTTAKQNILITARQNKLMDGMYWRVWEDDGIMRFGYWLLKFRWGTICTPTEMKAADENWEINHFAEWGKICIFAVINNRSIRLHYEECCRACGWWVYAGDGVWDVGNLEGKVMIGYRQNSYN